MITSEMRFKDRGYRRIIVINRKETPVKMLIIMDEL